MRLHRYRPFNRDFLRSEIVEAQVYLWRLNDQNDPHEGRVNYASGASPEEIRRFLRMAREEFGRQSEPLPDKAWLLGALGPVAEMLRVQIAGASDQALDRLAATILQRGHLAKPQITSALGAQHERMYLRTVMACFSGVADSSVMFAHYAGRHTGFCLTYEVDSRDLFQVTYSSTIPTLSLLSHDPKEIVRARLCMKHTDWAYEQEHRLVLYEHEPGLYSNPCMRLVEVCLGCRISPSARDEVVAMARSSSLSPLPVWQLSPSHKHYGFTRDQVA